MRSFMESNWIVSVWRNPNARTQTGIDSSSERTAIPTCASPITWLTGVRRVPPQEHQEDDAEHDPVPAEEREPVPGEVAQEGTDRDGGHDRRDHEAGQDRGLCQPRRRGAGRPCASRSRRGSRRPASGSASRNENSAAATAEHPRISPPRIVTMERDIPGQSEAHWKIPIQSATVRGITSTLSNRGVPPRARADVLEDHHDHAAEEKRDRDRRGPKRCRSMA